MSVINVYYQFIFGNVFKNLVIENSVPYWSLSLRFSDDVGKPDKNRLLGMLRGERVDRVPLFENYIDSELVQKILGYPAGNTAAAEGDPYKGDERAVVDGDMCVPMHPKDWVKICKTIGQDTIMMESAFAPYRKLDERGKLCIINDGSIRNREDWKSVIPPSDEDITQRIDYLEQYAEAAKNENIAVALCTGNFFITHYVNLCGMNFFMLIYDDIDLVHEMLSTAIDWYLKLVKRAVRLGIDILFSGDDVAYKSGLMINPEHFKELYKPYAERIYEPALNAGVPIIFDCDGKPDEIIDMIIELGCSALFPLDANGVDYHEYKKKWGNRLCLFGAIDTDPLIRGSVSDVVNYVRKVVEEMKPGGRYIAGTVSSVNEIPFDNFVAMVNAIHAYGVY
jgi:uroporphyrinogen decarboxylase